MIYPDLKNKKVVVTGSNRGIGKSIVKAFLENKSHVVALYRNELPVFSKDYTSLELLKVDIRDIVTLKEYFETNPQIDILINNAAVYENQRLLNTDEESWDRIMNINLKSTFFLSQLVAKQMVNNGGGSIINATSFAITLASLNFGLYAASKAALGSLTKTMAAEFAPYNIRVNAFSPGVIKTDMTRDLIEKHTEQMLQTISLHRFGETDEVAKAVLFLASEQSSYITGTNLYITGGKFIVQNPGSAWSD